MYYSEEEQKRIREAQDDAVREDAFAEGKAEGREEGRDEANRETARRMLELGIDMKTILAVTGLSEDDISALAG